MARLSSTSQSSQVPLTLSPSPLRNKTGCFTCRTRAKKCDGDWFGPCPTCLRLNVPCLGFGKEIPSWLRDNKTKIRALLRDHIAEMASEVLSLESFFPKGWFPYFASPKSDTHVTISSDNGNDADDGSTASSSPVHIATTPADRADWHPSPTIPDFSTTTVENETTLELNEFKFHYDPIPPRIWGEVSYLLYRPSPSPSPEPTVIHRAERTRCQGEGGAVTHSQVRSAIRLQTRLQGRHMSDIRFASRTEGARHPSQSSRTTTRDTLLKVASSNRGPPSMVQSLFY
ncbi:uncharacterized protein EI90DRAFT_3035410 [Cantharellus anzutake]|uniref:uncharacterized protein n=1 Tax=Cantharellus anzutake TaxID=1750568 RepID=UPI001904287B|nr:uncharacterized protein EI90DRAFT_3035410 [Cantharellus anzutake]KAF8340389.1 hypothetical protein EI90DRAFT_3035410 [Cantharellus anzutake]